MTQNLVAPSPHSTQLPPVYNLSRAYAAFLNAQGRVLHDVFIYSDPAELEEGGGPFIIEVDGAETQSLLKHLRKHKLRAKIDLHVLHPSELSVWSVWNSRSSTSEPPPLPHNVETYSSYDLRFPGAGRVLLRHPHTPLTLGMIGDGEEASLEQYNILRMLYGAAEGQREIISGQALPQESNIDLAEGIDFRKGCYLGQELTIRTHHTGLVRKRILPVQLYGSEEHLPDGKQDEKNKWTKDWRMPEYDPSAGQNLRLPPAGANISKVGARKGRSAGKWLGGVGNVGLALCRLETMTDLVLTPEGTKFDPQQEFNISWDAEEDGEGGEVRVKAFVPPWMRSRITFSQGPRVDARQEANDDDRGFSAEEVRAREGGTSGRLSV